MIKPKISKQKPIWSNKLEKEYQQELKNSSKISVIKERLNKNINSIKVLIKSSSEDWIIICVDRIDMLLFLTIIYRQMLSLHFWLQLH